MDRAIKPPLGIVPKFIWKEQRLMKLREAIDRYLDANKRVPIECIEEYNELLEDILKGEVNSGR